MQRIQWRGGGVDDVSVVYNGWKYIRREMVDCKM
jgi:hypothetical protein